MTTEELFNEVLKSPELQTVHKIRKEELSQISFSEKSDYAVIETIKTILSGQKNKRNTDQIFQTIQKQIMHI